MIFVPASDGSDSMSHSTGGLAIGWPDESRARIEARSKRNPSTCISLDPIPQAVHDHAAHDGVVGVQRVPGAAVIGVARAVLFEDVIGGVVQSAEAQRRPGVVTLGGVVEDHVENDFDARRGAAP